MFIEQSSNISSSFFQVTLRVAIKLISYSGADVKDKKIFAFVSNDPTTKAMLCHLFKSAKMPVCNCYSCLFLMDIV